MLLWATLIVNLMCYQCGEGNYVYNFHHSSSVDYFCDVKDEEKTDFHCYGNLTTIPKNLSNELKKLSITDSKIKRIEKKFLDSYRDTLRDM